MYCGVITRIRFICKVEVRYRFLNIACLYYLCYHYSVDAYLMLSIKIELVKHIKQRGADKTTYDTFSCNLDFICDRPTSTQTTLYILD